MSKSLDAQARALAALNVGQQEQQTRMPEPVQPRRGRPAKAAPKPKEVERFHLHLPSDAIHRLKVAAAKRGLTSAQVVLDALKQAGVL